MNPQSHFSSNKLPKLPPTENLGSAGVNVSGITESIPAWVWDLAVSPAGDLLGGASADGTVRLWEAATGDLIITLSGSGDPIWSVEFSPDGRNLVSASDADLVQIWGIAP